MLTVMILPFLKMASVAALVFAILYILYDILANRRVQKAMELGLLHQALTDKISISNDIRRDVTDIQASVAKISKSMEDMQASLAELYKSLTKANDTKEG